jgi:tetratricopeptide (TPR) repeat protein
MPLPLKGLRVFIASPGGLEAERKAFREVLQKYNEDDAHFRGVAFIPMGWEVTVGGVGRPQELINRDLEKCDYCVLVLHDRWGSPTGSGEFSSGCEEEYKLALACLADDRDMSDLMVCFKGVDDAKMADPGPQLLKVLDFRREMEDQKKIFYETFDEVERFCDLLRSRLAKWLRDHEPPIGNTGETGTPSPSDGHGHESGSDRTVMGGTGQDLDPSASGKRDAVRSNAPSGDSTSQRAARLALFLSNTDAVEMRSSVVPEPVELPANARSGGPLVAEARRLADAGELVDAEIAFSRAVAGRPDPDALVRFGQFLNRVGRHRQAEAMFERVIELDHTDDNGAWTTTALLELGRIHEARGNLSRAQESFELALQIARESGLASSEAGALRRLGGLAMNRGSLGDAEALFRQSLAIVERKNDRQGVAAAEANLGIILEARGDLHGAEAMYRKSLTIDETLGRKEGMAVNYRNLGSILRTRGDLDAAEAMHRQALAIDEQLGDRTGMAKDYGNLGILMSTRGNLTESEAMFRRALSLFEQLEDEGGLAATYGGLGVVMKARGELDGAVEQFQRVLAIYEQLGDKAGIATVYANLGITMMARGELDRAKTMYQKGMAIDEALGRKEGMASHYGNLGLIAERQRDIAEARRLWTLARDLYAQMGARPMVERVQGWLDGLPPT